MKVIVLYFSCFGNTKGLAEKIAQLTNAAEIQGIVLGGKFRTFLHMLRIVSGEFPLPDISDCDLLYIGGPVWAGGPAPGLKRILRNLELTGKKIKFFTRAGGNKPGTVLETLETMATQKGAEIVKSMNINDEDTEEVINQKLNELIA